jgi:L-fucose isomerase-like protein
VKCHASHSWCCSGNRDFFPDTLITEARHDLIQVFESLSVEPVWLTETNSKLGLIGGRISKCGELFRANRLHRRYPGVPAQFWHEKGLRRDPPLGAQCRTRAGMSDDLDQFGLARRRDAYCGKISVCNNLRQYGYKFSLTRNHTTSISSISSRTN